MVVVLQLVNGVVVAVDVFVAISAQVSPEAVTAATAAAAAAVGTTGQYAV